MRDEGSETVSPDTAVLDDPVGESLRGHHAHLARRVGNAITYLPEVSTFLAVEDPANPRTWDDVAALLGPHAFVDMFSSPAAPPDGWAPVFVLEGRQMIHSGERPASPGAEAADVVELTADDVPEMLDLIGRTQPGPFWARTHELGTYLGVRDNGVLVAMAGERLRPPGWTEVSAVCTAPEARGKGHAALLVSTLVARIIDRGERPFLHVSASNTAIPLYERLGFDTREHVTFRGFRTP